MDLGFKKKIVSQISFEDLTQKVAPYLQDGWQKNGEPTQVTVTKGKGITRYEQMIIRQEFVTQ